MTKAARSITAGDIYRLIPPQGVRQISNDEITIAQLLRRAGYATAHYGKWHLGNGGPGRFGYDEHDGDTGNRDAEAFGGDNPVDIFGMTARACAFMEKQSKAGNPFYLQMSYHALHQPQQAREQTKERVRRRLSGTRLKDIDRIAMAEDLDEGVGLLVRKIDEVGIADNTFVIYTSDNGAGGKNGYPLRGGKGSLWEGGIRVPFIVRGPNVKAGTMSNVPITGFDLLPTFCDLAGIIDEIPAGVDGGSIVPLLASEEGGNAQRPREELIFHFPHYQGEPLGPHSAIMVRNHKLIHFWETDESMLFDLGKDISEQTDITEKEPLIAGDLKRQLDAYLSIANAQLPRPNLRYDSGTRSAPHRDSTKTRSLGTKTGRRGKRSR
jgi:arylsulfatase A-like enzyme